MAYYIQTSPDKKPMGVWDVQERYAQRVGVPRPREHSSSFVDAEAGTIWDAFRAKFPKWFEPGDAHDFDPMELAPGQFYLRMARPPDQHPFDGPGHYPGEQTLKNEITSYTTQLGALTRQLERICRTIHPCDATLSAFGHDIRNLLILACTEVEVHWRGVLLANGYPDGRLTTNDYVKLAEPMRLREFVVRFPIYPWLEPVCPFRNWTTDGNPSRDLGWYEAYNSVKHDRDRQFEKATLGSAFAAVTACATMMWAQFGHYSAFRSDPAVRFFFALDGKPQWSPAQAYTYPYDGYGNGWTPINYPRF